MKRLFVTSLLIFAASSVGLNQTTDKGALTSQSAVVNQDRKSPGTVDYEIDRDFSGFELVGRFIKLPAERQQLQSTCQAKQAALNEAFATFERSLSELEKTTGERNWVEIARLHHSTGQVWLYQGEMAKAIRQFEVAYKIAVEHQHIHPDLKEAELHNLQALGVAHLRRGELENCTLNHNAEMCIFPLSLRAQHKLPSGSQKAVEYFTQYLSRNPGNLEVRWLLNVAYMTLGKYPGEVPKELLIPQSAFESKENIGRFADVASSLGIGKLGNAGGGLLDDFNNDGLTDVVISSVNPCEPLRFHRNNGDGTFSDQTAQAKLSDQLGGINLNQTDYNNDGWLDIFVMRGGWEFPMRNSLLRNNQDGTFTDVTMQSGLASPDHRTQSAAWADYNNDGWLDLYVGHENTPSQLFRNRGDGTFEDVSRSAQVDFIAFTKGVVWGDYDNDGYPDLYVSNYRDQNFLFHNNKDGTFEDVAIELHVEKPLWSFPAWFWDYDNDGHLDLFVASYTFSIKDVVRGFLNMPGQGETMKLYRNTGKGGFADVTKAVNLDCAIPAMGANFGDLDNDGFLDFYLGTGSPSYTALVPNFMFKNDNGKRFVDVTSSTGTGHLQKGHGVAFGDINNDGLQDIFANIGGAVAGDVYNKVLFKNPGGHGNNWLSVRLTGTKSNRAAIGAKVKLTLANNGAGNAGSESIRFREVTSGGSFGASALTQNIGLGKATRVKTLEVWWPTSNTRQTFKDIAANQFIEIKESDDKYTKRSVRSFDIGNKPHSDAGAHSKH